MGKFIVKFVNPGNPTPNLPFWISRISKIWELAGEAQATRLPGISGNQESFLISSYERTTFGRERTRERVTILAACARPCNDFSIRTLIETDRFIGLDLEKEVTSESRLYLSLQLQTSRWCPFFPKKSIIHDALVERAGLDHVCPAGHQQTQRHAPATHPLQISLFIVSLSLSDGEE